ncbi:MAG: hypothetical protein GF364_19900 [Candidatus Lokiarchaeota archaeon]|nr:hypothetical protein [Candidatus Lokiarchaeota archaeon]
MPRGMIAARWDDRLGVTPEASYPAEIENALEHDDLLTIFSTHAISEKSGILAMRIKRLNLVSYYSGLPEGDQTEQYFVVVILEEDEDPNTFEERLTEISKLIISSIDKPGFTDLFENFYNQLIKMEKITEEQRYAFIFRDRIRRLLLQKLSNGPMTKEGLAKWISKEINQEVTDIDGLLAPLKKTELIEEVNISKGKKVSLEYVFLMRDVAVIRIPNIEVFKAAREGQMAEDIRERYIDEVEKFFKDYRISSQDSGIMGEFVSNPDSYDVINILRNEYIIRAELPMKLSRDIPDLENLLKDLAENKIITAIKDKKQRIWVFLLSDIKFPNFFPEYMIDVIRRRWKEGTIAKEIALKHLELLRAEYIATQAPKYRKKLLKEITDYFENAENHIKRGEYDQAATIIDTMAGVARDMGERQFGELLDGVGKFIREDKERYIDEDFPEDRAKIIEFLEAISIKDEEKAAPRTRKQVKIKEEKKAKVYSGASSIGKMDGKKAEEEIKKRKEKKLGIDQYVEKAEDKRPEKPKIKAPPKEPKASTSFAAKPEVDDAKSQIKSLQKKIKQANKDKNLTEMARLLGELAQVEEARGNDKAAESYRTKQQKIAEKALLMMRDEFEDEANQAIKDKNFAKAAQFYSKCKSISNQLFKNGILKEAENAKKYAKLQLKCKKKAG